MDFRILLNNNNTRQKKDDNWFLLDNYTIQYNCAFNKPFMKFGETFTESMLSPETIRRDACKIYQYIYNLNLGYVKKSKIKSIQLKLLNSKKQINKHLIHDAFLEGLYLCNYEFNKRKTKAQNTLFNIKSDFHFSIHKSSILGNYIARDLVNEPLSHLTAKNLSSIVKKLGQEAGFQVDVLNEKKIKSLRMGGVLSVNKGSVAKPTFNILTYKPKKAFNKKPYVLVGKGVMYDTGGLSLKPTANSMDMMKCDMAGAASVIGTLYALATANTDCYVIGLIPAVENRPGGEAYVPGDVITMMNGLSVEVLNTDAEGRLILADALHYAKRYNPQLVIDVATLTGAAARAIGKYGIVAMEKESYYPSRDLYNLWETGCLSGEKIAIQPFWADYKKELKSSVADITNLGGAESGHITAGKFLEHFIDYPWIHLDIAGPAFLTTDYLYYKKGATGIGVRLLANFLNNLTIKK